MLVLSNTYYTNDQSNNINSFVYSKFFLYLFDYKKLFCLVNKAVAVRFFLITRIYVPIARSNTKFYKCLFLSYFHNVWLNTKGFKRFTTFALKK